MNTTRACFDRHTQAHKFFNQIVNVTMLSLQCLSIWCVITDRQNKPQMINTLSFFFLYGFAWKIVRIKKNIILKVL